MLSRIFSKLVGSYFSPDLCHSIVGNGNGFFLLSYINQRFHKIPSDSHSDARMKDNCKRRLLPWHLSYATSSIRIIDFFRCRTGIKGPQ